MVPLVLLPGLLCTSSVWSDVVDLLDGNTLVPEIPALDDIDDIAAHLLADLPPRFALGGLSMGGYIALAMMARAPERILALALVDTSARADTEAQAQQRRDGVARAQAGGFSAMLPRLASFLLHPQVDPAVQARVVAMGAAIGVETFARHQAAIAGRPDRRAMLAGIGCPATVLVGDADRLTTPDLAREMADAIPGAALEIIADAGHVTPLERPGPVAAALQRWRQLHR